MKVREYHQQARAEGVERTRTAILDAVHGLFLLNPGRAFSLDEVAERAGTTVQTILRHFGSKVGLMEAASLRGLASVRSEREEVVTGDIAGVAAYLGRHYEADGPTMLSLLAVEAQVPAVGVITARGRQLHRSWVERVFEPYLVGLSPRSERRRAAALAAVTDLLTWKVLRQEQGLTAKEYVETIRELLEAMS